MTPLNGKIYFKNHFFSFGTLQRPLGLTRTSNPFVLLILNTPHIYGTPKILSKTNAPWNKATDVLFPDPREKSTVPIYCGDGTRASVVLVLTLRVQSLRGLVWYQYCLKLDGVTTTGFYRLKKKHQIDVNVYSNYRLTYRHTHTMRYFINTLVK